MAFEFNDLKGILLLVFLTIPVTSTTNINCFGKPFHCLNSTHFMICVDLGGGLSTTIDDFVIPCPPTTVCHEQNHFECEFPREETMLQVIGVTEAVTESVPTSTEVTTVLPFTQATPLEEETSPRLELLESLTATASVNLTEVNTIVPTAAVSNVSIYEVIPTSSKVNEIITTTESIVESTQTSTENVLSTAVTDNLRSVDITNQTEGLGTNDVKDTSELSSTYNITNNTINEDNNTVLAENSIAGNGTLLEATTSQNTTSELPSTPSTFLNTEPSYDLDKPPDSLSLNNPANNTNTFSPTVTTANPVDTAPEANINGSSTTEKLLEIVATNTTQDVVSLTEPVTNINDTNITVDNNTVIESNIVPTEAPVNESKNILNQTVARENITTTILPDIVVDTVTSATRQNDVDSSLIAIQDIVNGTISTNYYAINSTESPAVLVKDLTNTTAIEPLLNNETNVVSSESSSTLPPSNKENETSTIVSIIIETNNDTVLVTENVNTTSGSNNTNNDSLQNIAPLNTSRNLSSVNDVQNTTAQNTDLIISTTDIPTGILDTLQTVEPTGQATEIASTTLKDLATTTVANHIITNDSNAFTANRQSKNVESTTIANVESVINILSHQEQIPTTSSRTIEIVSTTSKENDITTVTDRKSFVSDDRIVSTANLQNVGIETISSATIEPQKERLNATNKQENATTPPTTILDSQLVVDIVSTTVVQDVESTTEFNWKIFASNDSNVTTEIPQNVNVESTTTGNVIPTINIISDPDVILNISNAQVNNVSSELNMQLPEPTLHTEKEFNWKVYVTNDSITTAKPQSVNLETATTASPEPLLIVLNDTNMGDKNTTLLFAENNVTTKATGKVLISNNSKVTTGSHQSVNIETTTTTYIEPSNTAISIQAEEILNITSNQENLTTLPTVLESQTISDFASTTSKPFNLTTTIANWETVVPNGIDVTTANSIITNVETTTTVYIEPSTSSINNQTNQLQNTSIIKDESPTTLTPSKEDVATTTNWKIFVANDSEVTTTPKSVNIGTTNASAEPVSNIQDVTTTPISQPTVVQNIDVVTTETNWEIFDSNNSDVTTVNPLKVDIGTTTVAYTDPNSSKGISQTENIVNKTNNAVLSTPKPTNKPILDITTTTSKNNVVTTTTENWRMFTNDDYVTTVNPLVDTTTVYNIQPATSTVNNHTAEKLSVTNKQNENASLIQTDFNNQLTAETEPTTGKVNVVITTEINQKIITTPSPEHVDIHSTTAASFDDVISTEINNRIFDSKVENISTSNSQIVNMETTTVASVGSVPIKLNVTNTTSQEDKYAILVNISESTTVKPNEKPTTAAVNKEILLTNSDVVPTNPYTENLETTTPINVEPLINKVDDTPAITLNKNAFPSTKLGSQSTTDIVSTTSKVPDKSTIATKNYVTTVRPPTEVTGHTIIPSMEITTTAVPNKPEDIFNTLNKETSYPDVTSTASTIYDTRTKSADLLPAITESAIVLNPVPTTVTTNIQQQENINIIVQDTVSFQTTTMALEQTTGIASTTPKTYAETTTVLNSNNIESKIIAPTTNPLIENIGTTTASNVDSNINALNKQPENKLKTENKQDTVFQTTKANTQESTTITSTTPKVDETTTIAIAATNLDITTIKPFSENIGTTSTIDTYSNAAHIQVQANLNISNQENIKATTIVTPKINAPKLAAIISTTDQQYDVTMPVAVNSENINTINSNTNKINSVNQNTDVAVETSGYATIPSIEVSQKNEVVNQISKEIEINNQRTAEIATTVNPIDNSGQAANFIPLGNDGDAAKIAICNLCSQTGNENIFAKIVASTAIEYDTVTVATNLKNTDSPVGKMVTVHPLAKHTETTPSQDSIKSITDTTALVHKSSSNNIAASRDDISTNIVQGVNSNVETSLISTIATQTGTNSIETSKIKSVTDTQTNEAVPKVTPTNQVVEEVTLMPKVTDTSINNSIVNPAGMVNQQYNNININEKKTPITLAPSQQPNVNVIRSSNIASTASPSITAAKQTIVKVDDPISIITSTSPPVPVLSSAKSEANVAVFTPTIVGASTIREVGMETETVSSFTTVKPVSEMANTPTSTQGNVKSKTSESTSSSSVITSGGITTPTTANSANITIFKNDTGNSKGYTNINQVVTLDELIKPNQTVTIIIQSSINVSTQSASNDPVGTNSEKSLNIAPGFIEKYDPRTKVVNTATNNDNTFNPTADISTVYSKQNLPKDGSTTINESTKTINSNIPISKILTTTEASYYNTRPSTIKPVTIPPENRVVLQSSFLPPVKDLTKTQTVNQDNKLASSLITEAINQINTNIYHTTTVPTITADDSTAILTIDTSTPQTSAAVYKTKQLLPTVSSKAIPDLVTEPSSMVETINVKDHKATGSPIYGDMVFSKIYNVYSNATVYNNNNQTTMSEKVDGLDKDSSKTISSLEKPSVNSKREAINSETSNDTLITNTKIKVAGDVHGKDEKSIEAKEAPESPEVGIEIASLTDFTTPNPTDPKYDKPSVDNVGYSTQQNGTGFLQNTSSYSETRKTTTGGNYSKQVYNSSNTKIINVFDIDKEQSNNSKNTGISNTKVKVSNNSDLAYYQNAIKRNLRPETNVRTNISNSQVNQMTNRTQARTAKDSIVTQNTSSKAQINNSARPFDCSNHPRGKYADNNDCRKFYICVGHLQPIVGICPNNTVFSEINKQCTRNLSHCVRNNQFHCMYEGRFSDFFKDNIYYICVKNNEHGFLRYKLQCQSGYQLNKATVHCDHSEPPSQSVSSGSENSKITNEQNGSAIKSGENEESKKNEFKCKKEGKFPYSKDCKKYYECSKNGKNEYRRKIKKCSDDEMFDKDKKKCVSAESNEC
ncbi:uncharacterized protein LOC142974034 [Anticarsia gemmatalis]|uniref:uncharacterized protein LOC142974034 n=1 Tax=Anticarsia gemmatalis TaxID=129554 RepID=UPI003F762EE1